MKLLLYSGLLYLAGVAIVLILQPSIMFTEEGIWKEFGIGRNPKTHTWLPFWLFAVTWAIISYIIILMLAGSSSLPGTALPDGSQQQQQQQPNLTMQNFDLPKSKGQGKGQGKRSNSLIPGYYILNRELTESQGTPKYIYLGPEPPGSVE
jgi:hypothetical protein